MRRAQFTHVALPALALATAAALLSACVTDPFTGEKKVSKTVIGAGIGAAAGAGIGALTGRDRAKNAAIGAGAGALAGGAVGAYMDIQESKLRKQLEGTGVSVTREGDNILLNMPGKITFGVDRSEVRSEFYPVLNSVALVLEEYKKTLIEVTGHTDSTGQDSYNQSLSERRAESVGQYLVAQGIMSPRVVTKGLGERFPIASDDNESGRQQNRRVELRLIPLTEG